MNRNTLKYVNTSHLNTKFKMCLSNGMSQKNLHLHSAVIHTTCFNFQIQSIYQIMIFQRGTGI